MTMTSRAAAKADQITSDAVKLVAYMDREGLDGGTGTRRGREHMGGLIAESALQRRQKYTATVLPRTKELIDAWPDADTTTGFLDRIGTGTLSEVVRWSGKDRLSQMETTAKALAGEGVETVDQLRARFEDEQSRPQLRRALRGVPDVGPKTTDYIEILSGSQDVAAIDSRIRRATGHAGIQRTGYFYLQDVLKRAAEQRGWTVGSLDVVLWNAHPA